MKRTFANCEGPGAGSLEQGGCALAGKAFGRNSLPTQFLRIGGNCETNVVFLGVQSLIAIAGLLAAALFLLAVWGIALWHEWSGRPLPAGCAVDAQPRRIAGALTVVGGPLGQPIARQPVSARAAPPGVSAPRLWQWAERARLLEARRFTPATSSLDEPSMISGSGPLIERSRWRTLSAG